jgi:pilus assembly protein CpaF
MVQSMISGHTGSLTTVHATSPRDALVRLETLSLMSDVDLPVYVARAQVASAINIIVQLVRRSEDGSRKVSRIAEAYGLDENNQYLFHDIFATKFYGRADDGSLISQLEFTGTQPTFAAEPFEQGLDHEIEYSADVWQAPE